MTLEQLMAFSVTADQARQLQIWDNVSRSGNDEPYQIRRMLTKNTVRASDRRAQFIGLDTYEQAGDMVPGCPDHRDPIRPSRPDHGASDRKCLRHSDRASPADSSGGAI